MLCLTKLLHLIHPQKILKNFCFQENPKLSQASYRVQDLIIKSTLSPERQFKLNFPKTPVRIAYLRNNKRTKFQPPFNATAPFIYEPNTDTYADKGIESEIELMTYYKKEQEKAQVQVTEQPGFYLQQTRPDFEEKKEENSLQIIKSEEMRNDFISQMNEKGYVEYDRKKYWLPSPLCLNAFITSNKFKKFIFLTLLIQEKLLENCLKMKLTNLK